MGVQLAVDGSGEHDGFVEFSGIDPVLMRAFIADLERAGQTIAEHAEIIGRELAAVGVSAPRLAPIREIGGWAHEQLPRLRQRLDTITSTPAGMLSRGLLEYRESELSALSEARRLGGELGRRVAGLDMDAFDIIPPYPSDSLREMIEELRKHHHDPEFTAAFFTALGLEGTRTLTGKLRRLHDPAAIDIAGTAFATAVSGRAGVEGFSELLRAVENTEIKDIEGIAALLGSGDYPAEWLASIAERVLSADRPGADTLALTATFTALANNPPAARIVLGRLLDPVSSFPGSASLRQFMPKQPFSIKKPSELSVLERLNDQARYLPETADAFGRMLAAASGVYDEAQGQHSRDTADFAYLVMTTIDDLELHDATRIHLSEIAGSYAPEITLGADLGDRDMLLPSARVPVPESRDVPGLRGAFRLSPEDTFRFLTTFAGNGRDRVPFEAGMGQLTERLLSESVPAAKRTRDITGLDELLGKLGNVRGFELAAAVRVLEPQDAAAKSLADADSLLIGTGMGVAGMFLPQTLGFAMVWTVLSTGVAAADTLGPDPKQLVEELKKVDSAETLGRRYAVADLLIKQGYPVTTKPPASIADSEGQLHPFSEIVKRGNTGVNEADQWLIDNGLGTGDPLLLGELSKRLSDEFNGGKAYAFERATLYARELTTD